MKSVWDFLESRRGIALAVLLLVLVVLRLPNFFEPYWYGDEGIYLTIGNALNHGSRLYTDIVDHKTPMIYWLAMVGDQTAFRVLLTIWMIVSTAVFYLFALRIFRTFVAALSATSVFLILTTLPMLEGNIPNGELFVIGFVMVGMWLLSYLPILTSDTDRSLARKDMLLISLAGISFGLAILTKVPALLDFGAALSWFVCAALVYFWKNAKGRNAASLYPYVQAVVLFAAATIATVAASALYFWLRGSGQDYLQFGLLYNFHYASNWTLSAVPQMLSWAYSLPGKVVLLGFFTTLSLLLPKKFSASFRLILIWIIAALIGATLSNRPYPHYLLQLVPPVALLIGSLVDLFGKKLDIRYAALKVTVISSAVAVVILLNCYIGYGFYPTARYYERWATFAIGDLSADQYTQSFNYLMEDNYHFKQSIPTAPGEKMFIWGTNPMLYALTQTVPVGKFTVSFHIHDLRVYDETLAALEQSEPRLIVVMNGEDELPGLSEFLDSSYEPHSATFEHFVVWMKR